MNISKQFVLLALLSVVVIPMEAAHNHRGGRPTTFQRFIGLGTRLFLGEGNRSAEVHMEELAHQGADLAQSAKNRTKKTGNMIVAGGVAALGFGTKVLKTAGNRPALGNPFVWLAGAAGLVVYDQATPKQKKLVKQGAVGASVGLLILNIGLAATGA
ncbi:MAG TPA: hypothetical protein VGT41_01295 [Candidatus Babeliales bacterium]|nr:hypothetical protein [Candidatus Babeliales bacterium]